MLNRKKEALVQEKIEGDKKTPKGIFSLGPLFFRKDRNKNPLPKLKPSILQKLWDGVMMLIILNIIV